MKKLNDFKKIVNLVPVIIFSGYVIFVFFVIMNIPSEGDSDKIFNQMKRIKEQIEEENIVYFDTVFIDFEWDLVYVSNNENLTELNKITTDHNGFTQYINEIQLIIFLNNGQIVAHYSANINFHFMRVNCHNVIIKRADTIFQVTESQTGQFILTNDLCD